MSSVSSLDELIQELHQQHDFSDGTISLLLDKNFEQKDFQRLLEAMNLPDQTFEERREIKSWMERALDRGDSEEITTGRYNRYVDAFKDISSEQALVKGRMKFAVEYMIALADLVSYYPQYMQLVERPFSAEEKRKLRSIYKNFRTKDYLAVNIIEGKTNHDIVAANTWVTIRAQQLGLDDKLIRRITHFARTSSDPNTNVTGELYMKAIGKWASSLERFLSELKKRSSEYAELTCVAETHGQDAQLTTLGHIYANFAEQIRLHAGPFLEEEKLLLDGKMGGAIGTDVDMKVGIPDVDPTRMYKSLVEEIFGLRYVELGNDQDCSNAALSRALDTMIDVGLVIKKAATDTWLYASREILEKTTSKGESGSSIMPQKANPYFAEGCEAIVSISNSMINPIKGMLVAYREQGDLRRSITTREGYHPVMLWIIGMERLIKEMDNYKPNVIALEAEIYHAGPKIISSAISTKLLAQGIPDAYDRIKPIVMKSYVRPDEITAYINKLVEGREISNDTARKIQSMLLSVMDTEGNMKRLMESSDPKEQRELIARLEEANKNEARKELLGNAIPHTYKMILRIEKTRRSLLRYANQDSTIALM